MTKKICSILVDRANYARMKPVLLEARDSAEIDLSIVCAGPMLLERFGKPVDELEEHFEVTERVFIELEGSNPLTMTKSLGMAVMEFANVFQKLKPDMLLVIGDRYEALGAVLAAAYLNICIAHIQGGEVSGSIDESARHAITKFSHFHFPATLRAADYIAKLGEDRERIFPVGCPSGDIARKVKIGPTHDELNKTGVGAKIDPDEDYFVVLYHPVTTSYGRELEEMEQIFNAVSSFNKQTIWMWPNIDAGSDRVSKFLRLKRETGEVNSWLRFHKHFEPETFLRVLYKASCLIGNSSSFVRDSSFLGTPVVLVGDRQSNREIAENVIKTQVGSKEVKAAISKQLASGRFPPSTLYGQGDASQKIVRHLAECKPFIQKSISYVRE